MAASPAGATRTRSAFSICRPAIVSVTVFSLFINLLMLTGPLFMLQVFDRVLSSGSVPTLLAPTLLVVVLYALYGFLEFIRSRVVARVAQVADESLRERVFDAVAWHAVHQTPNIRSQPIQDLQTTRQFLQSPGPFALLDMPWTPVYLMVIYLVTSPGHEMAYSMLEYGILNQAGVTVVTGGIGCGKTTLIRQLLRNLDEHVTVGLLTNTLGGRGKLLKWIMMALNQNFESRSYVALYDRFQKYLIDEYAQGHHVILIIDEAQNLGTESLEELRMLSNINSDKDQLLQLVLIGQPQLRDLLCQPKLIQFGQRVSADFHLKSLEPHEVVAYIDHRLALAGARRPIFSRRACELIASASEGIPRTINILCDKALVYGFSAGALFIAPELVAKVLDDKRDFGVFSDTGTGAETIPFRPRGHG